ncbi:MAG TPA: hypothetical protein PLZ58_01795 [Candidatus Saccharibacteria bacterium]|nr:hypothetical protein [Candidatus Saccharibacteria bacterium]HRQ07310.1 hypothetical protein [Candidatus Saccharibacteria bacterium]
MATTTRTRADVLRDIERLNKRKAKRIQAAEEDATLEVELNRELALATSVLPTTTPTPSKPAPARKKLDELYVMENVKATLLILLVILIAAVVAVTFNALAGLIPIFAPWAWIFGALGAIGVLWIAVSKMQDKANSKKTTS